MAWAEQETNAMGGLTANAAHAGELAASVEWAEQMSNRHEN